jgi:hypothetical protein
MDPLRFSGKKPNVKKDFVGQPHRGLPIQSGHSGPPLRKPYMGEDFKYKYGTLLGGTGFPEKDAPHLSHLLPLPTSRQAFGERDRVRG